MSVGRPQASDAVRLSERVQTRLTAQDRIDFNLALNGKSEVWAIRQVIKEWTDAHLPLSTGNMVLDSSRLSLAGEMIRSANWQKLNLSVAVAIIRMLHESGALTDKQLLDWIYDKDTQSMRARDEIAEFRYDGESELFDREQ